MSENQRNAKDEEQGQSKDKRRSSRASQHTSRVANVINDEALGEYERIVRYASTYREPGIEEEEEQYEMKRVWYAPWKKRKVAPKKGGGQQKFPSGWFLTDIKQGLSNEEAANRRRLSGWNELTSEKENPIAKFMSYFKGPILYGKITRTTEASHACFLADLCHSYGIGCASSCRS
jgi:H+-transporting ATPase